MLSEERRQKIRQILMQQKHIVVNDLCNMFGISTVSIRNDLLVLEKRGVLTRVHGGAILNESSVTDLALTEKERIRRKEKEKIAKKAEEMIHTGDAIILDSGSTTTFIARFLKFKKGITVITNAVNIAAELAASNNEIILTGGILREKSFSLVGPLAEDSLCRLTADKLFLGVDGIHFDHGLTTPNQQEAKINQLMVEAASEVILVADSSKFGRRSLSIIGQISVVDKIITDKEIDPDDEKRLIEMDVEVIKC